MAADTTDPRRDYWQELVALIREVSAALVNGQVSSDQVAAELRALAGRVEALERTLAGCAKTCADREASRAAWTSSLTGIVWKTWPVGLALVAGLVASRCDIPLQIPASNGATVEVP
jgi:hypothetical protein